MAYQSDSLHQIVLHTAHQKPLLEGQLKRLTELGVRNLSVRFPGLKVVKSEVSPNRVDLTLDFQKLDEDVLRVIQSLKSEVKNLAKKKGFEGENLWQWQYEDHWIQTPIE